MYQNSFYPLRTIVGDAIPIGKESDIRKVFESEESKKLEIDYDFSLKPSILDIHTDPHYSKYLPSFDIDGTTISPGEGMDTLPLPPGPRPFGDDNQVISFFALSKKEATTTDVSRKLSARFSIQLPQKFLIGGICFCGFPYVPYSHNRMQSDGDNSSNFGLPREVRLTCLGGTADEKDRSFSFEFLDSEISCTNQDIVSHSGFHFLCIDPVLTNVVTLHFSDYPAILKKANSDSPTEQYNKAEQYGFIIPYFYVFEYREKTRYRPVVSAGLLGTTSNHKAGDIGNDFVNSIDHRHIQSVGGKGNYFDFTAASIFGQQRNYVIRDQLYDGKKPKGKIKEEFRECFISFKVNPEKNVVLYIEQGEEYERCVAGLKIFLPFIPEVALIEDVKKIGDSIREFYPDSPDFAALAQGVPRSELEKALRKFLKIPRDIDFCEKIGIRVYEIDPLEGVSPLKVELDGKYATLLAEKEIDELSEISLALFLEGIRFVRPSNSRVFAIELTNLDDKPGQFVVKGTKLIQSAHVSIHPRAARTQQVRTLNFRIIGPDLAEDYSFLGNEGFNFSIERFVAGERKSVLFRANSLLDLLHTGAAKIFGNVRRRGVEFEKSEIYPALDPQTDFPKYLIPGEYVVDIGYKFTPNYEKRFSESRLEGWRRSETGDGVNSKESWNNVPDKPYRSHSNQTVRSKNNLIYPDSYKFNKLRDFYNLVREAANKTTHWIPDPDDIPDLWVDSGIWRGISKNKLKIKGLLSVAATPLSFTTLSPGLMEAFRKLARAGLLQYMGGSSSSISASIGIISSTLGVNPYPSLQYQATYGTQGVITLQAIDTGYAYSQYLNNSYDEGDGYTEVKGGEMKRVITRKEVPDTDRQRVKGSEVMWQGELADIITGAIPLNFTLPATAGKMHFRTSDDSLRVRFGSGVGKSISVDFWFDVTEEVIRDDY
jgi:hypothetical protein